MRERAFITIIKLIKLFGKIIALHDVDFGISMPHTYDRMNRDTHKLQIRTRGCSHKII